MRSAIFGAVLSVLSFAAVATAQQPIVAVDGEDLRITGCITKVNPLSAGIPDLLVWSRNDIMLGGAIGSARPVGTAGRTERAFYDGEAHRYTLEGRVGTTGLAGRTFYWLDEDLSKYAGQRVEIHGDIEGIEQGDIEIELDGDMTDIEMDLDGREERARVPTAWLGPAARDAEFDIIAHKVDVDEVRVLGTCTF